MNKKEYVHVAGPSYGGLGVDKFPQLPIRDRENGTLGEIVSEKEMLELLVGRHFGYKQRFKGCTEPMVLRSKPLK